MQFALAFWVTEMQVPLLFNQSYFVNVSRSYFFLLNTREGSLQLSTNGRGLVCFLGGFVCKVGDSLFGSGLSVMKAVRMSYIVETSKTKQNKR